MFTRTPNKLTGATRLFCREVNSDTSPCYVPVLPEIHAKPRACFINVRAKVAQDGGKELNGWQLWTWPNVFIEAEHHCVWESPEGNLIDVTPKENGEKRIAFLSDPAALYDHENHRRVDNIRKALSVDPDIDEYLDLAAKLYQLIEDGSVDTGLIAKVSSRDLFDLQSRRTEIHHRLTQRYIKPKDSCPCGSGKKYFRCHGKAKDK